MEDFELDSYNSFEYKITKKDRENFRYWYLFLKLRTFLILIPTLALIIFLVDFAFWKWAIVMLGLGAIFIIVCLILLTGTISRDNKNISYNELGEIEYVFTKSEGYFVTFNKNTKQETLVNRSLIKEVVKHKDIIAIFITKNGETTTVLIKANDILNDILKEWGLIKKSRKNKKEQD